MNCAIISERVKIPNIGITKKYLRKIILAEFHNGMTDFYTNCEKGIPLMAAEIICELKKDYRIGLHIVVPYEEQAVDWSEKLRDLYYHVHEYSDTVVFACLRFEPNCYKIAESIITNKCQKILVI